MRISKRTLMNKKINSFIILMLLATTFNSYSMEPQMYAWSTPKHYVEYVGNVLLNNIPFTEEQKQTSTFAELPQEIQDRIIDLLIKSSTTDSLEAAGIAINTLTGINWALYALINNPQFCLQLIKHLAMKFNCSDEEVAQALAVHEAEKQLKLQKKLDSELISIQKKYTLNRENLMNKALNELLAQGLDLELVSMLGP